MEYLQVLLNNEGLRYALIGAILIGVIAPLMGSFSLTKKMALIPDTLAHVSLSGISFVWFLQSQDYIQSDININLVAIIATIIGALIIVWLRNTYKDNHDIPIAILLSTALGLTAIFIVKSHATNDLQSYLFTSIVLMNVFDLLSIATLTLITIFVIWKFYAQLLAYAFDEDYVHVLGINKQIFDLVFFIALAIVVSFTVRIVGVMLVSGLMTLPVAMSLKMSKSFKSVIIYSIFIAEISIVSGLISSYYLDLPVSGTIIIILVILFAIQKIFYRVRGIINV